MEQSLKPIHYFERAGIRCSGEKLSELESGQAIASVSREDVRAISWRYGLRAPSPVLQILFGAALASMGYVPARIVLAWLEHGGTFSGATAFLVPFPCIGLYLIASAFRRGYVLDVELSRGRKRLHFKGHPDPRELDAFRQAVEREWGLNAVNG